MSAQLEPGDDVVHAVHGPGKVIAVETREMGGEAVEYVTMEVDGMRILIPTTELAEVGVRDPISREDAEEILELLAEDPLKDPGHSARRRRNKKRLTEGDAEQLAKVVRSLRNLKADRDKGLAMRDRAHLRDATAKLVGEMAIALGVSEEEAEQRIDDAVARSIGEADGDG